jgi:putative ABC transport system permease protein
MFRIALRRITTGKRRLAGTVLAVFLGVAFLAGTLALSDTLRANFADLFAAANSRIDVVVRSADQLKADGDAGPGLAQRGLLDASVVDQVRAVPGVDDAVADISGYGQILGAGGKAIGGNGPPRLAGAWITDPDLNAYHLVAGRAPSAPDEVVINRGAAKSGHLKLGDTTIVETPEPVRVTIVGVATFGTADGFGPSTFVAFTPEGAAAHLTKDPTKVSRVLVKAQPGVSQATLAARVQAAVPPSARAETITGAQLTKENVDDVTSGFLAALSAFLLIFAGIALLVGTFSIYNSFSILTAQRTREAALLRTLGARRRQIIGAVLAETLAVGVVASLAGLAGGFGLAGLLKGLFDSAGFALPAAGLTVSATSLVVAFVAGLATTVLAGLAPAIRASRVPPLAALREVAVDRSGTSRGRAVAGAVLAAVGVAAVVAGVTGGSGLGPVGLGAVVTLAGLVVVGPVVAGPAVAVLGWPAARVRGVTGAMARENARRNPRRTAGSATALLVGVGVVVVFTVFASSLRASMAASVDQSFGGDLTISAPSFGGGGLSPQLASTVAGLPQVEEATGLGKGVALVGGTAEAVSVADVPVLGHLLRLDVAAGSLDGLGDGQLAVSSAAAGKQGWHVGTVVPVGFADGTSRDLTVAAVYRSTDVAGDYLLARSTWAPHAPQDTDRLVFVSLRPGVTSADGKAAVTRAAAPFGRPPVQDRAGYVRTATQRIDMMLGIVYVLLALSILIALMGIANTLALSVHERTREIGLLRAVGQTRRQMRAMLRREAVVVALFGTLGGVGLGVFLGWALVSAAGTDVARLTIPVGRLVAVVAAGAVAGVLAGVRPARRAARLDVLSAVAADAG